MSQTPPTPIRLRGGWRDRTGERALHIRQTIAQWWTMESLWSTIKTLSWLMPLTILIWIYAQRELTIYPAPITVPIAVISSDPNTYVELKMSKDESAVQVSFSGQQSQLDELAGKIGLKDNRPSVVLNIPSYDPGPHDVQLAPLLNDCPLILRSGVKVEKCEPSTIHVTVDRFEQRTLAITKPESMRNIKGNPVFDVTTVQVRAPQSAFARLDQRTLHCEADLAGAGENSKGKHDVVARLYVPGLPPDGVTYVPPTVKAQFETGEADDSCVVASMAIIPSAPLVILNQYEIQFDDRLPNVKVNGPTDAIAALQKDPNNSWAVLTITAEDRAVMDKPITRGLTFRLPDPALHVSADDASRTITFTLSKRATIQ